MRGGHVLPDIGKEIGGEVADEEVTLLGNDGWHMLGRLLEPIPIALADPEINGFAINTEAGGNLGLGEAGIQIEIFSVEALLIFHIDSLFLANLLKAGRVLSDKDMF
jgi:hypothetical protein